MRIQTTYGVLWDMDGVLVDSGDFHYLAWVEALGREGLAFAPEQFRATFGMDNRGVLASLLGREPEPGWLARVSDEKEAAFPLPSRAGPGRCRAWCAGWSALRSRACARQ